MIDRFSNEERLKRQIKDLNAERLHKNLLVENLQDEIDQLKAKNAKLVHAVVNANEQKSHWAKQYWQGVERSAEYQAMLMNHPDQMAVECFKREKRIEQLEAELAQFQKLVVSLRGQFDLWADGSEFSGIIEAQIDNFEAMRGEE